MRTGNPSGAYRPDTVFTGFELERSDTLTPMRPSAPVGGGVGTGVSGSEVGVQAWSSGKTIDPIATPVATFPQSVRNSLLFILI